MDLLDRIPPHSPQAERAVLGAAMREPPDGPAALEAVLEVPAESFYFESHRAIAGAIRSLAEREQPVTDGTVTDCLRELGLLEIAGGPAAVFQCFDEGAVPATVAGYVRIIEREAARRQGIQALTTAIGELFGPNGHGPATSVLEIASRVGETLGRLAERVDPDGARDNAQRLPPFVPLQEVLDRAVLAIQHEIPDLIPTPIQYLNDRFGGGFKRRELVILGGGPGIAKTAMAIDWARYIAKVTSQPVGIVSIEMGNEDLAERFIAQAGPVSATAIRKRDVDFVDLQNLTRALPELAQLPIELSDQVSHVLQIGRMLRRRQERGLPMFRLLIVDYLQLLDAPKAQARYQEVAFIAKLLKRYAKRFNLTMLALSSFTPDPVPAGKKPRRPSMRNLRESRDLDHAADVILLLWRPSMDSTDRELIIDKGRAGETGACTLGFTGQYLTFQERD